MTKNMIPPISLFECTKNTKYNTFDDHKKVFCANKVIREAERLTFLGMVSLKIGENWTSGEQKKNWQTLNVTAGELYLTVMSF